MSHAVQFYSDDVFLIDAVSAFIRAGYEDHAAVIVIATEQHRAELRKHLMNSGDTEIESGVLYFDAMELLSAFMINGSPDQMRFISAFEGIIQRASLKGPVRIFGEMVSMLWAQGNPRAAIRLEELWNELAVSHILSLLCAYPMSGFPDQHHDSFRAVCEVHTHCLAQYGSAGHRLLS